MTMVTFVFISIAMPEQSFQCNYSSDTTVCSGSIIANEFTVTLASILNN